jgi:hypothetical protein
VSGRHLPSMACAVVGLAVWCASATAAAATALPSVPIPQNPNPGVPAFQGHAATAQPLPPQSVPQNPFLAPNGRSNIHDDTYMTDAYARSGPLGQGTTVSSTYQNQECASVTFDTRGRIVTVCVGLHGPSLEVLDPTTLGILAALPLPPRDPSHVGAGVFTDFGSGGYFYLDNQDRAVVPTTTRHILVVAEAETPAGTVLTQQDDYDLTTVVPLGDEIESALPDWSGRIWFVSTGGVVGTVDPSDGHVASYHLPPAEAIGNSFAADETGAMFIVSDHALYRFTAAADGTPQVSWRTTYDRGTRLKPGQANFGSGTTPTITTSGLVAITDNADPQMHVVVYRRDSGAQVCEQAVFTPGQSDTENSLVAAGDSLFVENNYGYSGPSSVELGGVTTPGIARVDVDVDAAECRLVWTAQERAPSVVAKVSLGNGLLYTYTKDPAPSATDDPWYLTAIDARSGTTVFKVLAGTGLGFNNNYAPVSIGADGALYVGVLGGLVRFVDAGAPAGGAARGGGGDAVVPAGVGGASPAGLPSTDAAAGSAGAAGALAVVVASAWTALRRRGDDGDGGGR